MNKIGSIDLDGNEQEPEQSNDNLQKEENQDDVDLFDSDDKSTDTPEETEDKSKEEEEKEEEEENKEDISKLPEWAKTKLEKAEEERENYKTGLINAKKKLKEQKKEQEEKLSPSQKQTLEVIHKSNETQATKDFIEKNEISDDLWSEVVENYTARHGKETKQDIEKDLEDALFITMRDRGELDKLLEQRKQAEKANLASISGRGGGKAKAQEKEGVSETAKEMGKKMKVNPDDLEKEDDSFTATIEI